MSQTPAHLKEDGGATGRRGLSRRAIVLIVILVVCATAAALGVSYLIRTYNQISDVENSNQVTPAIPDSSAAGQSQQLVDNPIDFDSLTQANADVYAWIYVPNTNVNLPVVQSADDSYYLRHDVNGNDAALGAIFTESAYNTKSFADPVTIIYGHNGINETMFGSLHRFQDADFFAANDSFYVYTPGHIYTYRIVSAYTTNDQHLMLAYDGFDADGLARFEADVQAPNSISEHTRDVSLDADSRFVVLSTCNTGAQEEYGRYLVCGVMVDDQQTR